MRVGLIIYGRLSTISGGYLYDRKLVEYLREQGDRVEIISLPWSCYGRHLTHNFSRTLFARLRRGEFDLLLQDELNHPSLFWLNRRLRRRVNYPIVSIVHHLRCSEARPAWQNRLYRVVERAYLASVDGFIFNSQTTQTVVQSLAAGRPSRVVYPAGDQLVSSLTDADIVRRAETAGPLRLAFVGGLIRRKGLHHLLAALARLPFANWRLEVAGDTAVAPTYSRTIRLQIAAANLDGHITCHGPLDADALTGVLARSHLLAIPSSYEGFGIAYLEGMGFGLPTIAGRDGAAHEIITDGLNGFLVAPAATEQLAAIIKTLHQDRPRLARMGLAARRRYLTHPTWAQSMAGARQFLQRLMIKD